MVTGPAFEEYAEAVYARCMHILAARLTARTAAAASPTVNGSSSAFHKAPGALQPCNKSQGVNKIVMRLDLRGC